jgi:hypothetical protein
VTKTVTKTVITLVVNGPFRDQGVTTLPASLDRLDSLDSLALQSF